MTALDALHAFGELVDRYNKRGKLQSLKTLKLTGLIYTTLYACIDLELGGRAREAAKT